MSLHPFVLYHVLNVVIECACADIHLHTVYYYYYLKYTHIGIITIACES